MAQMPRSEAVSRYAGTTNKTALDGAGTPCVEGLIDYEGVDLMDIVHPEDEWWSPVPGSSRYLVSSHGRVYSTYAKRYVGGNVGSHGYRTASIHGKNRTIHSLVAEAFIGPRPEGLQVRHLDGNKWNNDVNNLAYGTCLENKADDRRLGVGPAGRTHCPKGHELTEDNIYWRSRWDSTGNKTRSCKTCTLDRVHAYQERKRREATGGGVV